MSDSLKDALKSIRTTSDAAYLSYVTRASEWKEAGFVGRTLFTVGKVPFYILNRIFGCLGDRLGCQISDTTCFWIFFIGTVFTVYSLWTHADHVKNIGYNIRQLPEMADYAKHVMRVPGDYSLREPVFPFTFTWRDGEEEWLPIIKEQMSPYVNYGMFTLDQYAR
jgi:hypothetical protein